MKKIYKMTFPTGGGTIYENGLWEIKHTNKTVMIKCVDGDDLGYVYRIKHPFDNKHKLVIQSDGDYVLYANRSGTPLLFEEYVPKDDGNK